MMPAEEVPMDETAATPKPEHDSPPFLEYERLDCYRLAIEFQGLAAGVCSERRLGALRDQLERASLSIAINIAEGAGPRGRGDRARFFTVARGSAMECAALLEVAASRGLVDASTQRRGRGVVIRIVQMLTRLIHRPVRAVSNTPVKAGSARDENAKRRT
jgi:four helix bundle protein